MAISGNEEDWFLINASPDIGQQIFSFPSLHPKVSALRHSPIQGILLTNADLDHVLGLLLLREGAKLSVHATPGIQASLEQGLRMDSLLNSFCGITWHSPSFAQFIPLLSREGKVSGLQYRAIPLPGIPPPFARSAPIDGVHSLAYLIRDDIQGKQILIAPDVAVMVPELEEALQHADVVFWDGTFWSDDELKQTKPSARSATEIGHLPIFPGILNVPRKNPRQQRFFIHLNNTNPVLDFHSLQLGQLEESGWKVGYDGLELRW